MSSLLDIYINYQNKHVAFGLKLNRVARSRKIYQTVVLRGDLTHQYQGHVRDLHNWICESGKKVLCTADCSPGQRLETTNMIFAWEIHPRSSSYAVGKMSPAIPAPLDNYTVAALI